MFKPKKFLSINLKNFQSLKNIFISKEIFSSQVQNIIINLKFASWEVRQLRNAPAWESTGKY